MRPNNLTSNNDPPAVAELPAVNPRRGGGAHSKSGRESADDVQLMRASQKGYNEMMKGRKDELRRKRGALE